MQENYNLKILISKLQGSFVSLTLNHIKFKKIFFFFFFFAEIESSPRVDCKDLFHYFRNFSRLKNHYTITRILEFSSNDTIFFCVQAGYEMTTDLYSIVIKLQHGHLN